ncbi:MAG: Wadjet anti-phage system protein JetA family protein [Pseudomonadota bacterium]
MFFTEDHPHLFRPLTGKYREQVVACLSALYSSVYTTHADYSRAFDREQVLEVFAESVTRTPLLDGDDEVGAARGEREQANWVLNLLLEHGWLERQTDEATLQSSYAFTRVGRLFTQPMVESAGGRFRTRHRNTRNTRNALRAFLDRGEVYDLLDAYEFSERIVADFSDIITELDERKRQLVRDVEAQQIVQHAADEFFDFMEKRFMPDLAIRLSADSVEKYRDEIAELIGKARRKHRPFKAEAERELRRAAPELLTDEKRSLYLAILDGIDARLHASCEVMLPALRRALHGFTRRADLIIRQLTFSGASRNELLNGCKQLATLDEEDYNSLLTTLGEHLSTLNVGFADPEGLRLHTRRARRTVNTAVETEQLDNPEERRKLFVQQAMDRAFTLNNRELRDYLVEALAGGHAVRTGNLPVRDARDLMRAAHAIEVGTATDGNYRFRVEPTGQRIRTDFYEAMDEFEIELLEVTHDDAPPTTTPHPD